MPASVTPVIARARAGLLARLPIVIRVEPVRVLLRPAARLEELLGLLLRRELWTVAVALALAGVWVSHLAGTTVVALGSGVFGHKRGRNERRSKN